jgi:hypothetical protein
MAEEPAVPQRVTCPDTREKAIDRSPVNPSPPVAGVFAFRLGRWPSPVYGSPAGGRADQDLGHWPI